MPDLVSPDALPQALRALAPLGIGWACFVPAEQGPDPALCATLGRGAGLLILMSFGSRLAEQVLAHRAADCTDPIDDRSRELADGLCRTTLPEGSRVVYPGPAPLDLRRWLSAGGAQWPSRLGTGIRPDAGLWLAVRAAIVTRLSPDQREALEALHPPLEPEKTPCESCGSPCITACPAGAVGGVAAFDLEACVDHRLRNGSGCALRCPARLACPEGQGYRYAPEALRYHYGVSLRTLQRWRSSSSG